MIRPVATSPIDWLDGCCWRCGTDEVAPRSDGRVLCGTCRKELLAEPAVDALALARHAYWETHALRCCWRCMVGAVDPGDEVGLCGGCRDEIGRSFEDEGAA